MARRSLISLASVALLMASAALSTTHAAPRGGGPFGLGAVIGEPSGISGKLFLDKTHAIDGALSYSLIDDDIHIHATWLLHFVHAVPARGAHRFIPYTGIGGRLRLDDDDDRGRDRDDDERLGVRAPLGIAWMPRSVPVDVFLEVSMVLDVIPETDVDLEAALGARYFF